MRKKNDGKDRYRRKAKPCSKAYYNSNANLRAIEQLKSLRTDQGSQFTSDAFTGILESHNIDITWTARAVGWTMRLYNVSGGA